MSIFNDSSLPNITKNIIENKKLSFLSFLAGAEALSSSGEIRGRPCCRKWLVCLSDCLYGEH